MSLSGVYAITDTTRHQGQQLIKAVAAAIAGGVRIVQYRDKTTDNARRLQEAHALAQLCAEHGVLLIINDDPELALNAHAGGVHLGGTDAAISEARALFDRADRTDMIIGASCYDQRERAEQASAAGADYLAFGAMFPSPTKPHAPSASPELLHWARQNLSLPVCAIGGITEDNLGQLKPARPDMVAVVSGLFHHTDIQSQAACLNRLWQQTQ